MSNMTLLEAAKSSQDVVDRAITRIIVESSPILEDLPFKTINGPVFRYTLERSLGSIAFRGVNGTYTADNGVINPQFESLVIWGGEVKIDNFIVDVEMNVRDAKSTYYGMKARAMGLFFSEAFFEGDTAVNPFSFDGLRKRIPTTSGQYINAGTGGATLTLAMLDQLLDKVVGPNEQKRLYMNKTMRRKITELVRAQTGTARINYSDDGARNAFNRQMPTYAGAPIYIVEREDDESTILGFDEDDGAGNLDTTSIYCCRYGMQYVHGISNKMMPQVKDFGEQEAGPFHMGRIEAYGGIVVRHPRSMARLGHINNA